MGVLADSIDEFEKLPPAAKVLVGAGAVGVAVLFYLHARAGSGPTLTATTTPASTASGGDLSGLALPTTEGYGTFTVPGGPPSASNSAVAPVVSTPAPVASTPAPVAASAPPAATSPTPAPVAKPAPVVSTPTPKPVTAIAPRTYTVKSGDTLGNIAYAYHVAGGAEGLYNYGSNRRTIGGNINLIRPGQVLQLPG